MNYTIMNERPLLVEHDFTESERLVLSAAFRKLTEKFTLSVVDVPCDITYDEFILRNSWKISQMLNFNWNFVAKQAADIVSFILPLVDSLLSKFITYSDILILRGIFIEQNLPVTPHRSGKSIHSITNPNFSFIADYLMHALAYKIGQAGGFAQSNINYVDSEYRVTPLYAHIDRGAKYTFLSCVRRSVKQDTVFATWNVFFENFNEAINITDNHGNALFVIDRSRIRLSEKALHLEYNWLDIASYCADSFSFHNSETMFNMHVDRVVRQDWVEEIDLQNGDILIFKNANLVHGRSAATITKNAFSKMRGNKDERWLRVLFT